MGDGTRTGAAPGCVAPVICPGVLRSLLHPPLEYATGKSVAKFYFQPHRRCPHLLERDRVELILRHRIAAGVRDFLPLPRLGLVQQAIAGRHAAAAGALGGFVVEPVDVALVQLAGLSKSYSAHSVVPLWSHQVIRGTFWSLDDFGRRPSLSAVGVSPEKQCDTFGGCGGIVHGLASPRARSPGTT